MRLEGRDSCRQLDGKEPLNLKGLINNIVAALAKMVASSENVPFCKASLSISWTALLNVMVFLPSNCSRASGIVPTVVPST